MCGGENPGRLSGLACEGLNPGNRHHRVVLLAFDRLAGGRHVLDDFSEDQRLAVTRRGKPDSIDVGGCPDFAVLNPSEDRVAGFARGASRCHGASRCQALFLVLQLDPGPMRVIKIIDKASIKIIDGRFHG
jgi:hypothetical protein